MGACQTKKLSESDKAEAAASAKVAKQLTDAQQKDSMINKLLLLGAGESGKSTLFKQMIVSNHYPPYTPPYHASHHHPCVVCYDGYGI
jgi:guanine nucleotide-binding protein G(t) subunit alpha 3